MTPRQTKGRNRLTADHWADAALDAMARGGLSAVAVEPLARKLGVTKGSFYWHFENREALIRAALSRWEARATLAIQRISEITDPRERLRTLLLTPPDRSTIHLDLAVSLSANDPRVRSFASRVDRRWLAWAESVYREMGMSAEEARHWGMSAYSAYGGLIQLIRLNPGVLKDERSWARYARHVAEIFVP